MPFGDIFRSGSAIAKVVAQQAKLSEVFNPENYTLEDVDALASTLHTVAATAVKKIPSASDILAELNEEEKRETPKHPELSPEQSAGWRDVLTTLGISIPEELSARSLRKTAEETIGVVAAKLDTAAPSSALAKTSGQLRFDVHGSDGSLEDKALFARNIATSASNISTKLQSIAASTAAQPSTTGTLSEESKKDAKAVAKAIVYAGEKLLERNGDLSTFNMIAIASKVGLGNVAGNAVGLAKEVANESARQAHESSGKEGKVKEVGALGALSQAYQTVKTAQKSTKNMSEAMQSSDIGGAAIATKIAEETINDPKVTSLLKVMAQKAKESPEFVKEVKDNIDKQLEKLKKKKPELGKLISAVELAAKEPNLANTTKVIESLNNYKGGPDLKNAINLVQILSGLSGDRSDLNPQNVETLKKALLSASEDLLTPERKAEAVSKLSDCVGKENATLVVNLLEQAKDNKDVQSFVLTITELANNPSMENATKLAELSEKFIKNPESMELLSKITNSEDMQLLGTIDFTKAFTGLTKTLEKASQDMEDAPLLSAIPQLLQAEAPKLARLSPSDLLDLDRILEGNTGRETKQSESVAKASTKESKLPIIHEENAEDEAEGDARKFSSTKKAAPTEGDSIEL